MLFTHAKHNPSERKTTLAYRIVGGVAVGQDEETRTTITSSHVVWDKDPVDITADAAVTANSGASRRRDEQIEVRKWLHGMLAAGAAVPQKQIMEEGAQRGFSEKQIRTAAGKLNVKMENEKSFKAAAYWSLPM